MRSRSARLARRIGFRLDQACRLVREAMPLAEERARLAGQDPDRDALPLTRLAESLEILAVSYRGEGG